MRYSTARRIILVSSIFVTTCFLLAGKYELPGGASHFTAWANLIAFGGSTTSDMAQRDVGYPLLLVIGGYPFTQSFVGITLINTAFSVALPLLAYGIVGRGLPAVAFGVAVAVIFSATPYVFLKMIHHDQAYLFFTTLTLYCGVTFLRRKSFIWIYSMTGAALAASLIDSKAIDANSELSRSRLLENRTRGYVPKQEERGSAVREQGCR
jgi:hypothetical protein